MIFAYIAFGGFFFVWGCSIISLGIQKSFKKEEIRYHGHVN